MDKAWTDTLVEALRRLDPTRPAEEEVYIGRRELAVGPGWDLPERLGLLLRAGIRVRALLHGCIGAGKTTEFCRWQALLRDVAEVIVVRVEEPRAWAESGLFRAVAEAIELHLNLSRVKPSLLTNTLPKAASLLAVELKPQEPSRGVQESLLTAIREGADQLSQITQKPCLLLVDGLDLLSLDEARRAFGPGTALCDPALPSVVYTAPHGMLMMDAGSSRDSRFDQAWHLPLFPVVSLDRKPLMEAVDILAAGLARRLQGLRLFTSPEYALRGAAFRSGGIPRDAIRILRAALIASAQAGRVNDHHIYLGVREVRQDLEQGLGREDIDRLQLAWNRGLVVDPRLVSTNALLPYQGDERLYWLPHPLLWSLLGVSAGEQGLP